MHLQTLSVYPSPGYSMVYNNYNYIILNVYNDYNYIILMVYDDYIKKIKYH